MTKRQKDRQHNDQKKKRQQDKQRSTKHTYKTKDRVTRTPLKTNNDLQNITYKSKDQMIYKTYI
jgi:hypothetical protein